MIFLPFIISGAIGYLLLGLLTKKTAPLNFALKVTLGIGLGLGLSSHLTFYSFLFFNKLEPQIIIAAHIILLISLIALRMGDPKAGPLPPAACEAGRVPQGQDPSLFFRKYLIPIVISIFAVLIIVLVIIQARFYPYGGWDAWQVWNFKAKFLLLSGDNWKDLFSPELWRSSPHYPLLLPLINVWAWLFTNKPLDVVPMITSVSFTFLTIGLMCSALWQRTKNIFSLLPGFLLLTLPFFNLLATTQYCDIVLSFYCLAALVTLQEYKLVSGVFTGCLAFTKPEGMVAAMIICAIAFILTIRNFKDLWPFIWGLIAALLPAVAFHVLCSPGNQTFVNGLTSALKPATWERLQMIFGFLSVELTSNKWNGLWLLLLLGIVLGGKNVWTKNKITAGFLVLYLAVIIAYYEVNTYFEIKWWLSVSLNRILFSLLPLFFFWVFSGILPSSEKKRD